jgi:hypothetical protein
MLVERLNLVRKVQEVNDEYGLNGRYYAVSLETRI